ncbi:uncharacterized protein METZ01_LOCUS73161 [marine metagenome]|uniref:Uncharacterized protein n=1 Tax=marine metagenome TaxID=408172 RepID=A0A381TZ63_9ZZZZ
MNSLNPDFSNSKETIFLISGYTAVGASMRTIFSNSLPSIFFSQLINEENNIEILKLSLSLSFGSK